MLIEEGVPHDSDEAVEFRSMMDDAWHHVLLDLVVNMLFVMYVEVHTTKKKDVYGPHNFDTLGEVEDFRMRFRPSSEPVRDDDCTDVKVGMTICVIKNFGDGDWRLYDGVVNAVNRLEHKAAGTEDEECRCDFLIFWKHGPFGGTVTSERLDNIYLLVPDNGTHHALIAFMEKTRQRFQTPRKCVQSPTPRMGPRNDRYAIKLLKLPQSSARHGDSLPKKWKLWSGELPRAQEMEKPLRMPGIVEKKPTIVSSQPTLVSSVEGIRTNHGMSIEFRSLKDDAWRGVSLRVTLAGKLVINYDDYTMFGMEETHEPDEFNTPGEIEDFRERFRPLSLHLSPRECHEVKVGNLICVSYEFEGTEESRFYDSVVKEVIRYQHTVLDDNEEETCFCSFEIFWKHGPKGGTISTMDIHRICMTVPAIEIHPALVSFLDIARRELGRARKRARIDGQNPNLPPGFYAGDDHRDVTLSRGEPSKRDKGKKIVINDR